MCAKENEKSSALWTRECERLRPEKEACSTLWPSKRKCLRAKEESAARNPSNPGNTSNPGNPSNTSGEINSNRMQSAREHAKSIVEVMAAYARQGSNLCLAARAGARSFQEWIHYPANDAVDAVHQTEFYYHTHAKAELADDEHGHFHIFSRPQNNTCFHHLIAISLNPLGRPTRLFLTNQWVTGEVWLSDREITPLIDRFNCHISGRLAPVSRWISSMVGLFAEDICLLHQQRVQWLDQGALNADERVLRLQSQDHHIVAQAPIDLERSVARALFPA